jgi:hypothetical protein
VSLDHSDEILDFVFHFILLTRSNSRINNNFLEHKQLSKRQNLKCVIKGNELTPHPELIFKFELLFNNDPVLEWLCGVSFRLALVLLISQISDLPIILVLDFIQLPWVQLSISMWIIYRFLILRKEKSCFFLNSHFLSKTNLKSYVRKSSGHRSSSLRLELEQE